jgi:hypothetical protein
MKFRLVLSALVAGLLASSTVQAAPVVDNVVFGNMGPTGSDPLDSGNVAQMGSTVSGSSGNKFAVAFTTGTLSNFLKIQSVTLGLGDISPFSTAILNLVADNSSSPTGSTLATQSLLVQANGLYTFGLGTITLAPSTTYWVTLEADNPTAPSTFSWLRGDPTSSPTGQNGSGYTFPSNGGMRSQNGGSWTVNSGADTLSINVSAVPEPSTYALAAVGLGLAGFIRARRRRVAV